MCWGGGAALGDWALTLWDLTRSLGTQCQNWIKVQDTQLALQRTVWCWGETSTHLVTVSVRSEVFCVSETHGKERHIWVFPYTGGKLSFSFTCMAPVILAAFQGLTLARGYHTGQNRCKNISTITEHSIACSKPIHILNTSYHVIFLQAVMGIIGLKYLADIPSLPWLG